MINWKDSPGENVLRDAQMSRFNGKICNGSSNDLPQYEIKSKKYFVYIYFYLLKFEIYLLKLYLMRVTNGLIFRLKIDSLIYIKFFFKNARIFLSKKNIFAIRYIILCEIGSFHLIKICIIKNSEYYVWVVARHVIYHTMQRVNYELETFKYVFFLILFYLMKKHIKICSRKSMEF